MGRTQIFPQEFEILLLECFWHNNYFIRATTELFESELKWLNENIILTSESRMKITQTQVIKTIVYVEAYIFCYIERK